MLQNHLPTMEDIWAARKTISGHIARTPLFKSPVLSDHFNASVYLKLETAHEVGAFKVRGAANKLLSLTPAESKRGVATFSTGNHGIAVAYMAGRMRIPAVVCLSQRVPEAKINVLKRLGATVKLIGNNQDDAERCCYELAREQGLTVIKPFDDFQVIAGQGTIGLELMEDCPAMDTAIIPVSGGGLFSGVALALKTCKPDIQLWGVSMERSPVMYTSLQAGRPVMLEEQPTLADSLLGGIGLDNQYTFAMVQKYIDNFVLVSEEAIAGSMAYLFKHHRLVAEGAAATGIAALLGMDKARIAAGSNIIVIVTGNNVGAAAFVQAVSNHCSL